MKVFYVYEWYNVDTGEVFYVGKGCGKRASDKSNRNQLFLSYIAEHNTNYRIVKTFDDEAEAFIYEEERIKQYKSIGQCQCCLQSGGYGGYSNIWDENLKQYWSENNPMKRQEQRERMSKNNPMYDKDVAAKVGAKHKRQVIINGTTYDGVIDASRALKKNTDTIIAWCKQGYNSNGEPCRYANEEQKEYEFKPHKPGAKEFYIDDILYPSLTSAARALNITTVTLNYHLRRGATEYKGHKIRYANQQPSQ